MRLLSVAGVPLVAVVAVAGCGSSSKHAASKPSKASTTSTMPRGTSSRMPRHGSMMPGSRHPAAFAHAGLTLRSSHYGQVIFDAQHRALYLFAADHGASSTCYGACSAAWSPMLTKGAPTAGAGLNASLLGTTKRKDGSLQVTYAGHPLYYWSGDKGSEITCQHVNLHGGFWYIVKANGTANMAKGEAMM